MYQIDLSYYIKNENNYLKFLCNRFLNILNNYELTLEETFDNFINLESEDIINKFRENNIENDNETDTNILDLHYILVHYFINKMRNIYCNLEIEKKKFFYNYSKSTYLNEYIESHHRILNILEFILEIDNLKLFEEYSTYLYNITNYIFYYSDYKILLDDLYFYSNYVLQKFTLELTSADYNFLMDNFVLNKNILYFYSDYFFINMVHYTIIQKILYLDDGNYCKFYEKYRLFLDLIEENSIFLNLKFIILVRLDIVKNRNKLYKVFKKLYSNYLNKINCPNEKNFSFYDFYYMFEYLRENINKSTHINYS
jgi:hypothetical protein